MKGNGKTIKRNLAMKRYKVEYIMDSFRMIKETEKVNFFGIMANIIKANGKMGKNKEMDYGKQKREIVIQVSGEMEK